MSPKKNRSSNVKTLRYRAENVLKTTSTQVKKMSLPEIQHLVHELQVYEIELEMQNEELRQTQLELQQARDRYADLYDLAPVGFLTLNAQGQILEANLPACQLLGVERKTLLGQKLEKFVMATDQQIFRQHLHHVEQGHTKEISDVIRLKHDHSTYVVRLESLYEAAGIQNLEARFRIALLDRTEQEQTKALQKEQEIWVSAMLDSAMDAIITIDRHQKIVLFNASAEQMFGCTTKKALGQSIDRFIPQRFRKAHVDHIQDFERGSFTKRGLGSLGEVTGLRANGEEFPLEASISKVLSGKGVLFTVILRDITVRRTMENELEKEKQFIATVLDSVGALVLILDLDWRIVRCNRVCEALTGRKMADMRGKSFLDFSVATEEEAPKLKDLLYALKGKKSLISFENAWADRDRQLHWIRWFNTVLTDKDGKAINVIATGVDITERKKVEEEMDRLSKHNELILNSAWEGIYGLDRKGKVTFFNRSAEQLTGWEGKDLHGQVLHSLLHHTKRDGTSYLWKNCPIYVSLRDGKVQSTDSEVLWRKDGTCFDVEYTSMPFQKNNKVEGAVVTFRDITERKKSEAVLRQREIDLSESQKVLQALGGKLISAQEDERRRISRELHDDMNQRLAVLAFNIQSAQKEVDTAPLMRQTLQKLYDEVSSLSDDVRHLAYQLHPSILDDLGLEVALRSFVDDFSKWEGIPVTFTATDMPVTLPQNLASCLYRVTQEGMRNVSRHAQATQCDVRLIGVDGGLRLSIQDNGKGFGIKGRKLGKYGLGLIGMEERVRVVQGTYEVKSASGQGTQIMVWVPIPKEESL